MSIEYPSYEEIINRTRAAVAALLPDVDPTIFGSFTRGFSDSQSGRSFDIVLLLQQLEKMLFPQTSIDEFLDRWGNYEGLTRNAAAGSDGPITITGTPGKIVDALTNFSSVVSNIYLTEASVTLAAQSISVSSLTRSGTTVTATTPSAHQLASGIDMTIAGAVETDYNGTYEIAVVSELIFTYEITGTPTTPATGTITASFDGGFGTVESEAVQDSENDINVNLDSGAQLTLVTPISGVDATAYVQFSGVSGGTDKETDERYLIRILQSRSNPVANFNVPAIEKLVLAVPGVTRVLVKRITPHVGAVTVLFVRDDDDNIIPDASEVQDVEDVLLEVLPAQSAESDLIVSAPTPVTVPFTFTSISPDSSTMRTAIEANLAVFFQDDVTFETNISEDAYRSAIIETVDPETGDKLQSFTLSTPTTDVTITTNEIGVLGTITF